MVPCAEADACSCIHALKVYVRLIFLHRVFCLRPAVYRYYYSMVSSCGRVGREIIHIYMKRRRAASPLRTEMQEGSAGVHGFVFSRGDFFYSLVAHLPSALRSNQFFLWYQAHAKRSEQIALCPSLSSLSSLEIHKGIKSATLPKKWRMVELKPATGHG